MRKSLAFTCVALILLITWIAVAFSRQTHIRSEVKVRIGFKYPNADVLVPIVPLLKNPFRSDPKVYLILQRYRSLYLAEFPAFAV